MSDKLHGGIKAARTSISLPVELRKAADSTELTGIVYSGVTASYWRQGGTRTAITTATLSGPSASYSSGGFVEVDSTNMPGVYRLDVPDAAFATGADWVAISVKVATAFTANFFFPLETKGAADLNDIAATAIVSSGAITTSGGAVTTVTSVTNAVTVSDKTGYSLTQGFPSNFAALGITAGGKISGVVTTDTATALTTLPTAPTDWLTAAAVKADAVAKIQAGLMLATSYTEPPTTADIREAIFTKPISSGTYPTSQFGGLIWRIDNRAGSIAGVTPLMAQQVVRIHAATVDSATVSGTVITLTDGTTQTVTDSGRVTILA